MSLPTPTLHTARLQLRHFNDADADALFALQSSAYVLRYWDAPPWSERVRAERFITACRQMAEEGTGTRLALDRVSDGAFIGWCSLTRRNPDHRSASLGYCLDDAAWGHGYATEAARALLQWGFDTQDLNRVQAETDTRHLRACRHGYGSLHPEASWLPRSALAFSREVLKGSGCVRVDPPRCAPVVTRWSLRGSVGHVWATEGALPPGKASFA